MSLQSWRISEENQIILDGLSLRQKSLQCETFTSKFGHFKSCKAVLADGWNIQKFGICFGHTTAENSTVQELYNTSHRREPHT